MITGILYYIMMNKFETSFLEVTLPTRDEARHPPELSRWPLWRQHWARFRITSREKFPLAFLNRKNQNSIFEPATQQQEKSHKPSDVAIILLDGAVDVTHPELMNKAQLLFSPETEEREATVDHATAMASIAVGQSTGFCSTAQLYSAPVVSASRKQFEKNLQRTAEILPELIQKHHKKIVIVGTFLAESSRFVEKHVESFLNLGAPVVWAAGNRGGELKKFSPTKISDLILVGASNFSDGALWEEELRTHHGPELTLFSPGKNIMSAWSSSGKKYNLCSGTSPAAMITAAVLSQKLAKGYSADHFELKKQLIDEATQNILLLPKIFETGNRLLYSTDGGLTADMVATVKPYA